MAVRIFQYNNNFIFNPLFLQLTLSEIAAALKIIGRSTDKVANVMEELSAEYSEKFRRAFGMKPKH